MAQYEKELLNMTSKVLKNLLYYQINGFKINGKLHISLYECYFIYQMTDQQTSTQVLGEILELDRRSVGHQLSKLQKKNLIEKSPIPEDKRKFYYRLSPDGLRAKRAIEITFADLSDYILKDLTVNDEKGILKYLSKMNQTTRPKG